jgi:hypothetical protein
MLAGVIAGQGRSAGSGWVTGWGSGCDLLQAAALRYRVALLLTTDRQMFRVSV